MTQPVKLRAAFLDRSTFGLLAPPACDFVVEQTSFNVLGGPSAARIVATGEDDSLWDCINLLRCGVEIHDERADVVWWGYVHEVRVSMESAEWGVSMDEMSNSVAVAYTTQSGSADSTGVRATTAWAKDTLSISDYGEKQALLTANNATMASANAMRDQALAALSWPAPVSDLSEGRGAQVVLICKGWWSTLDWLHYSNTQGAFGYYANPDTYQKLGESGSRSIEIVWNLPAGTDTFDTVGLYCYKGESGTPAMNINGEIRDTNRSGALLATFTITPSDLAATSGGAGGLIEKALSTTVSASTSPKAIVLSTSTQDAVNHWRIGVTNSKPFVYASANYYDGSAWNALNAEVCFKFSGVQNNLTQITAMVTACAQFISGIDVEGSTTIATNPYRNGDATAGTLIVELLAMHTGSSGSRLALEVTRDRRVRIYNEPTQDELHYADRQMRPQGKFGEPLEAHYCLCGVWLGLRDVMPISGTGSDGATGVVGFVESADYNAVQGDWVPRFRRNSSAFDTAQSQADTDFIYRNKPLLASPAATSAMPFGGFLTRTDADLLYVPLTRTLVAGTGINTIGDLSASRVISVNYGAGLDNYSGAVGLGAPGALSVGTTNSVFGTSHTHAIASSSNPGAAASLLATDVSGYLTLVRQTLTDRLVSPLLASISDLTLNAGSGLVKLAASNSIQSGNFASQTTGFRATYAGEADFRYLYTDELRAKTFTVDLTAALAGSERITKSFGVVYQDFTLPAGGGSTTFIVRDHPSAPAIRVFEDRDFVQFRVFTRTAGDLTIADAWGDVKLDTTYGSAGFLTLADGTKTQRYTFNRRTGLTIDDQNDDPITDQNGDPILANNVTTPEGNAGAVPVLRDSIVLDYGRNQGGWHETTTVDGSSASWFNNSPYSHVVTWSLHPKNATVRARMGNLRGITGVANEFGLFAGAGTSNADQFIRVSSQGVLLNNVPLQLFSAGSQRVNIDANGNNVWFSNDGGVTKALSWNGSTLSIVGAITVTGGNALTSGSAAADVNANSTLIAGGKISAASLDVITANMGLLTAGEILLGNQTSFSGTFTGLRMRKAGSTYELAGYNAGVVQAYFGSDGKLYAGTTSDSVVLASSGVSLLATPPSYPSNMGMLTWKKFNSVSGLFDEVASIGGWYLNSATTYFQINCSPGIAISRLRGANGFGSYLNVDSLWATGWTGGSGFVRADAYFQSGYYGPTWVLGNYVGAGVGGYTGYIEITVNGTLRKVAVYA